MSQANAVVKKPSRKAPPSPVNQERKNMRRQRGAQNGKTDIVRENDKEESKSEEVEGMYKNDSLREKRRIAPGHAVVPPSKLEATGQKNRKIRCESICLEKLASDGQSSASGQKSRQRAATDSQVSTGAARGKITKISEWEARTYYLAQLEAVRERQRKLAEQGTVLRLVGIHPTLSISILSLLFLSFLQVYFL